MRLSPDKSDPELCIFPWIYIYQKQGMSYPLSISLIFISVFFIIGYVISTFYEALKEKKSL